jgi:hypothetical protein
MRYVVHAEHHHERTEFAFSTAAEAVAKAWSVLGSGATGGLDSCHRSSLEEPEPSPPRGLALVSPCIFAIRDHRRRSGPREHV